MKRILNYMWMAVMAMAVAVSFSSCLDSDNDSGLTDDQKKQYSVLISGSYTGKLVYYDETLDASKYKNQLDTISGYHVYFRSSDNVATLYDFPTSLLVKAISGHEDLKEALKKSAEEVDIQMNYAVLAAENGYVTYYLAPQPVYVTLEYGGKTHDLAFVFTQNVYYSVGQFYNTNHSFGITLAAIYDGKNDKGEYTQLLDDKALLTENTTQKEYNNIHFEFSSKK